MTGTLAILGHLVLLLIALPCGQMDTNNWSTVTIKQGTVNGVPSVTERGIGFVSYLGIPYARPPVEELRFQDPVPHPGWQGELNADSLGHMCPQWNPVSRLFEGQEDCLTLNVFTPQVDPLPIMFYIHGGAFRDGSSGAQGAAKLMSDGSVMLVSVNYRLGVLGFLSLENSEAPGNYGMLDLVLALRWVHENIQYFGGDPERVTIFGQSAGSIAVTLLIMSPLTKGLFWAAIAQSGSLMIDTAVAKHPLNYARRLATLLECNCLDNEIVDCLRQKSSDDILKVQMILVRKDLLALNTGPVVDNRFRRNPFLPEKPEVLLASGNFSRVPLMTGVTTHEGLFLVLGLLQYTAEQIASDPHFMEKLVLAVIASFKDKPIAKDIFEEYEYVNLYFKNTNRTNIDEIIPPFTDLLSQVIFHAANDRFASMYSKMAPVYMYVFDHRGNVSINDRDYEMARSVGIRSPLLDTGVNHADELIYLFNIINSTVALEEDQRVQDIMVHLWTTFAKFRNPNLAHPKPEFSLKHWTNFETATKSYFSIGPSPHSINYYRQVEMLVYEAFYDRDNSEPVDDGITTWMIITALAVTAAALVITNKRI